MSNQPKRLELAIFDGRILVGTIRQIEPGRFEAIDPHGRVLGRYKSQRAASAALPHLTDTQDIRS
jgi:hypothetical protein